MASVTPPPPEVLLLCPLFPALDAALSLRFRLLKPWESPLPLRGFLAERATSVRALVCDYPQPVPADVLDRLPCLELVVTASVGIDNIDVAACRRHGIAVANLGAASAVDTAEYALGLLIDVLRRISASGRYVRQGRWSLMGDYPLSSQLNGKRVGILGLGSVGFAVANRLEAFGCSISYHSRTQKPSVSYEYYESVNDLAVENNILIVSCSLTEETFHIIDRQVLLALGKDGVIINVGRGPLIDEKELVRCLVEGEIAGVGLDVFENEPLVPEELYQMDNVVLSNHAASLTSELFDAAVERTIANLEAFFSNQPLVSPIRYDMRTRQSTY